MWHLIKVSSGANTTPTSQGGAGQSRAKVVRAAAAAEASHQDGRSQGGLLSPSHLFHWSCLTV